MLGSGQPARLPLTTKPDMRSRPLLSLLVSLATLLPAATALAQSYKVFISTPQRQLRSIILSVNGFSQPVAGNATRGNRREQALADARRQALETARATLEWRIRQKNAPVVWSCLGAPGKEADVSVFVHEETDLGAVAGDRAGVSIKAEVAYVVTFTTPPGTEAPAERNASGVTDLSLRKPDDKSLADKWTNPDSDKPVDYEKKYQEMNRALQEQMNKLIMDE